MTQFDERLEACRAETARLRRLTAQLEQLRAQRGALADRTRMLRERLEAEQADVDRLEGKSLAALLSAVTGKRGERLDRERAEAAAAAAKYGAAARELEAVDAEIREAETARGRLQGCEKRYAEALAEKAAAIKAADGAAAKALLELEERLAAAGQQVKEIAEAASAGRDALRAADAVAGSLDSAEHWGTWDLWGGGMIADLAKHSRLDEAQDQVQTLQRRLRRFQTELADVQIPADLQVQVDGFLRFADFFFDGLFADWVVLDHIRGSQEEIWRVRGRIQSALDRLAALRDAAEARRTALQKELDDRILTAT